MAESGRAEELRRRLERDPGSRLFAQLAEELRKDGDLLEAVRVARAGLAGHPSYTSARLTLGRALEGLGRLAEARVEYEAVLAAAPDNLVAGRQLAECLEGLGEPALALQRCELTLGHAPGDRVLEGRVVDLKRKLGVAPGAGVAQAGNGEGSSAIAVDASAEVHGEGVPQDPGAGAVVLASPTLAELYFQQGSTQRAVEVYRQVVTDEPENAKARARLSELEEASPGGPAVSEQASPGEDGRRAAVARVIGRLEQLLRATRRA